MERGLIHEVEKVLRGRELLPGGHGASCPSEIDYVRGLGHLVERAVASRIARLDEGSKRFACAGLVDDEIAHGGNDPAARPPFAIVEAAHERTAVRSQNEVQPSGPRPFGPSASEMPPLDTALDPAAIGRILSRDLSVSLLQFHLRAPVAPPRIP